MSIMSWNCRGLGNPRTVRDLCRLVKVKKPEMVFLMETIMGKTKMERIRRRLGFPNMLVVDCVGKSGGLALLWTETIEVEVQNYSSRHINAKVNTKPSVGWWKFTGFYGHPEASKRKEAWGLIRHLATLDPKPWICVGDFNEILYLSEKWGGNGRSRSLMADFQSTLVDCELVDMGFRGPKYTWNNGREGKDFIQERLDRAVVNDRWSSLFPQAEIVVEGSSCSDHLPLFVVFHEQWRRRRTERRFIHEASWEGPEYAAEIANIKLKVQSLMEQEEIKWKQRARVEWLRNGDKNTRFFHACANQRSKSNSIRRVCDLAGNCMETQEAIGDAFVDYFRDLFTSGRPDCMEECLGALDRRITDDMNKRLLRPFTEEEVSTALHQMAPMKAPGPDGFNACFFQKNWNLLGPEVCNAVLFSLNSGVMNKELNSTYITLIPKSNNPLSVSDYRPISLCNVLYKLISKVLANRLKEVLPAIISPYQSAFIPGRLITDNILAAYETLHTMQSRMYGKNGFMAVKLDMSKAYDRVEWVFLEAVMRRMGFANRWINLIMMCVCTAHFSVLVNGTPVGPIIPTRGIRQGDPISPYLFILCAEALSGLLSRGDREGFLRGVPTSKMGPRLNHLFFADDSLLFCRADVAHWHRLTGVLKLYERASGQKLNATKTAIFFSRNTTDADKEDVLAIAAIPATQRYDTYLGLPALVGKSRIKEFKAILSRVEKRLNDWKLKFLSQAGKEILLKAVVQAIPTYSMSVFKIPKELCNNINSLMQKFWWGHKTNESRIHWMSWGRLGLNKVKGGMGFREFGCFNKALLAKQVWRLWKSPDSLVARILKAKYFPRCEVLDASVGTKPSYAWRSIISSKNLIHEGLFWRIGNGAKACIWGDKWVPLPNSFRIQSPPTPEFHDSKVCALIDEDSGWWNSRLLGQLFNEEEVAAIQSLPLSSTSQADMLIWRGTANGIFSVKSAYHLAKEVEDRDKAGCSMGLHKSDVWKLIWKLKIPNVEKNFIWRACQDILPTRDNLLRRRIAEEPIAVGEMVRVEESAHVSGVEGEGLVEVGGGVADAVVGRESCRGWWDRGGEVEEVVAQDLGSPCDLVFHRVGGWVRGETGKERFYIGF
ncbi:uncharacterized protein LOC132181787 [Corylus avellana]|uniref:uncharacterized protein LOC132181787 n=1 Tax=Corylus avellana TaxID=13451 RepID=UPI00286B3997|nr:uncharacterized protein LOC132181787 [Corylus avellana]